MQLPPPDAEDAFIAGLLDAGDDHLHTVVQAAIGARRLQLAARVVGLLDDPDDDNPDVQRAQRVARLVLVRGGPATQAHADELLEAWGVIRSRRIARRRERAKARLGGGLPSRLSKGRRR